MPLSDSDGFCPRCGSEAETTMHRLWDCTCNAAERAHLDDMVPGNIFPVHLPACLARCGLVPANLPENVSLADTTAVSPYLLRVNAITTQALADRRAGRP
eukprot:7832397-Pyramimonas_sp.AAC.1